MYKDMSKQIARRLAEKENVLQGKFVVRIEKGTGIPVGDEGKGTTDAYIKVQFP